MFVSKILTSYVGDIQAVWGCIQIHLKALEERSPIENSFLGELVYVRPHFSTFKVVVGGRSFPQPP